MKQQNKLFFDLYYIVFRTADKKKNPDILNILSLTFSMLKLFSGSSYPDPDPCSDPTVGQNLHIIVYTQRKVI